MALLQITLLHPSYELRRAGAGEALDEVVEDEVVEQRDGKTHQQRACHQRTPADVNQLIVSGPWHPPERKRWCLHGCRHDTVTATRAQRLRPETWDGRGLPRRGGRLARPGGRPPAPIPQTPGNR